MTATIAVGHQHNINGFTDAFAKIYKTHGLKGLWRGATGSMVRVTVGSSVQLPTFTKVRGIINDLEVFHKDSLLTTFVSATVGGFAVCTAMTPADVVSTRLYNQPVDPSGKGLKYTGIIDCAFKIFKTEGIIGFYKGWSASLLRLGPHTVLSLCFWQELRKAYKKFEARHQPLPKPTPELTTSAT
jgi:solute carrier family 25 protein 34/35